MIRLRDLRIGQFAVGLAVLAVYLQLALASWGMLVLAVAGAPTDALGGHALCLGGTSGDTQPTAPANGIPAAPVHDHFAFCCLWHSIPGVAPQASLLPRPVVYAAIGHDEPRDPALIPGPPRGPANARAPPTLT